MNTAQLEYNLRRLTGLLEAKEEMWENGKQAHGRLTELAEYFSGEKALSRVGKTSSLSDGSSSSPRRCRARRGGLDAGRAQDAPPDRGPGGGGAVPPARQSLQIKQFLGETRALLSRMVRVVNIRDNVLVTLSVVSDMAYAWEGSTTTRR